MNLRQTRAYFSSLPEVRPEYPFEKGQAPVAGANLWSHRDGLRCAVNYSPHTRKATRVSVIVLGRDYLGKKDPRAFRGRVVPLDEVTEAIFEHIRQKHGVDREDTKVRSVESMIDLVAYQKVVTVQSDADTIHRAALEFITTVDSLHYEHFRKNLAQLQSDEVQTFLKGRDFVETMRH